MNNKIINFHSIDEKFESPNIQEISEEYTINFDEIIIPFLKFGESKNNSDIYNGSEKILFSQRHSLFQIILENEFSDEKYHEISEKNRNV